MDDSELAEAVCLVLTSPFFSMLMFWQLARPVGLVKYDFPFHTPLYLSIISFQTASVTHVIWTQRFKLSAPSQNFKPLSTCNCSHSLWVHSTSSLIAQHSNQLLHFLPLSEIYTKICHAQQIASSPVHFCKFYERSFFFCFLLITV